MTERLPSLPGGITQYSFALTVISLPESALAGQAHGISAIGEACIARSIIAYGRDRTGRRDPPLPCESTAFRVTGLMTPFDAILTHPGGAHNDEFLACSVLLAGHPVPIIRRAPADTDLADPRLCVVDVGQRHEPALNNFDHHQLPKDHPPTCALSLVLQHLGLYDDARQFCEWLETTERFDSRGPIHTAKWLGVTTDALARLNSPIHATLLRRFALATRLESGEPLWEIMRMIGEDIVEFVKSLRERLDLIARQAEFWTLDLADGPAQFLFLPRTEPVLVDPSFGLDRFIQSRGLEGDVVGIVSPDRRSTGYGLERFRDNPRLDFTRLADRPGVHYAHARGFVAKTTLTDVAALKALLALAAVSGADRSS